MGERRLQAFIESKFDPAGTNAAEQGMKKVANVGDKVDQSLKKSSKSARESALVWTEFESKIKAAERAFGAMKQVYDETIGTTVAYDKQVRDLAANLNISTEETSRIVQAMDDFGVEAGAVESALEMMVKRGMAPSVESLAQLADQYTAIQDPVKRAAVLTEVLGKNWTALTPALKMGGDAIRDQAAAIDESLVRTKEQVESSRRYEIAMDNLNDSLMAIKVTAGSLALDEVTADIETLAAAVSDPAFISFLTTLKDINDFLVGIRNPLYFYNKNQRESADAAEAAADAAGEWGKQAYLAEVRQRGLTDAVIESEGVWENFAAGIQTGAQATDAATAAYDEATQALRDLNVSEVERAAIEEQIKILSGELTQEDIDRSHAIAALTVQLREGNITSMEYIDILQQIASGAYDAKAAIDAIGAAVDNLPTFKQIQIQIDSEPFVLPKGSKGGSGTSKGGEYAGTDKRAAGGPVSAGTPYIVGERGPELFIPSQNGNIVPSGQSTAAAVGPAVGIQNIYINEPGADPAQIARVVLSHLQRATRRGGALGYAGH